MANNVVVGYSPNDFYYVQAQKDNTMPTETECTRLKLNGNVIVNGSTIIDGTILSSIDPAWDTICKNNFSNNSSNCVKKELCKNRDKSNSLTSLESSGLGAKEKYMNEKMNYDSILMNSINLGIGIIFLLVVIYKNQK